MRFSWLEMCSLEVRYGRLLLYVLSRIVMLYPMYKAFSLLPSRTVKTILALPVGLLLVHNYFVVRGLLVACRKDWSLDLQSVKLSKFKKRNKLKAHIAAGVHTDFSELDIYQPHSNQ